MKALSGKLLVLGVGILLCWKPAYAQAPTARAVVLFREANTHFNLGQYELAVDKYTAAINADPSLPGAYRNLGLTYRALRKCDLALPNFRRYLVLQPHGRHAKRAQEEIDYCSKKIGGQAKTTPVGAAHVVLHIAEQGARIMVNGVLRGVAPTGALPVQPGKHTLSVYLSGFLPWNASADLREGQILVLDVHLTRDPNYQPPSSRAVRPKKSDPPGVLNVVGLPRGASVRVDGIPLTLDGEGNVRVKSGRHVLEISGSQLVSWSDEVVVLPNKTTTVTPVIEVTPRSRALHRWAWVTLGAAAAIGLAGCAVGLAENRTVEDVQSFDRTTGSRTEINNLMDRQRDQALASNLLYGFAVAALGASIVLFIITPETARTTRVVPGGIRF